jgi:hypothetical protein
MPRYSKAVNKTVERAEHGEKRGRLRSGEGANAGKVTTRGEATTVGSPEARKKGSKVPAKKS